MRALATESNRISIEALNVIVSYQYNFIFIRTRKTAGSTIEAVLKPRLGPKDIYVDGVTFRGGEQSSYAGFPRGVQHMTAAEMITLVSPEFWNQCYRFTAERHPYEKAVSLAYFNFFKRQNKSKKTRTFEKFLDKIVQAGHYRSYDYYTMDGHLAVNDFVRHERLHEDLERIGKILGIEIPCELPRKKDNFRKDARSAREILSERQKRIVYNTSREEFELLGYAP